MAKKNKSDMVKGIRRSILSDEKSVDTEKESNANLQTAASIAKIAVTLDGFTAATLGSDKNFENIFLDILNELKEIPTSLGELEKKNSKVIESITAAILKLEKELENTNDPKKQKTLIEAIAKLKGQGQAAIDKSAADKPKERKGPTSIKELLGVLTGVTPESKKAAGGSSLRAFANAVKKDARATFGLETPDAPAKRETIEGVLKKKRVQEKAKSAQKKIGSALEDERGVEAKPEVAAKPRARKKKVRDRNKETPAQPKVEGELGAADTEYLKTQGYDDATITKIAAAKASSKPVATATPNETKTPQSSIFAGADSGSDTGTPDNKLLEIVTNIDETTTKILGAIEMGGGGGGGGGGLTDLIPRRPFGGGPRGGPPGTGPKPPGRFGRMMRGAKGLIGRNKLASALIATAAIGTAAYAMRKKDAPEGTEGEGTEGGEPTAEGTVDEGMSGGTGAVLGAGLGVAGLGGAALYAGSGGSDESGGTTPTPGRLRDPKTGRFTTNPTPVKGPGLLARGKGAMARMGKFGGRVAGKLGGVASKFGGKTLAKVAGKGVLKSVLKKIPVIGAVAGLGFAASRALRGDFVGAGMEAASGLAGGVGFLAGGTGTVASIGMDVALAARDAKRAGAFGEVPGEEPVGLGVIAPPRPRVAPARVAGDPTGRLAQAKAVEESTVPTSAAAPVTNNTTTNNVNNVTNGGGGQSSQGANISLRDTHSSYMRFRDNRMSRVM